MVRNFLTAAALAGAMCMLAGCASIVHGTSEKVRLDSDPGGAEVVIDDARHVTTPAVVRLSRKTDHKLKFHKPGYQDDTETLTSSVSGWVFGNLVSGGLVGAAIDVSDGAARKLSSDQVNASLKPIASRSATAASAASGDGAEQAAVDAPPEGPPPESFRDDEVDYGAAAGVSP
ncbi:MAG: PEGA domain-containing protein [Candidatus Binataceae bacterium]